MKKHLLLLCLSSSLLQQALPQDSRSQAPAVVETAQTLFQTGINHYYNGNMDAAIASQLRALAADQNFDEARLELIALLKEAGRLKEAETTAKELYLRNPEDKNSKSQLFITAVQARNYKEARSLLPADENNAEALFYWGLLEFDQKSYSKAIELFTVAAKLKEDLPEADFFKGLAFQKENMHKQAVAAFRACLKTEPSFTTAFYPLGVSLYKTGQTRQALNTLYRARSNLPESKTIRAKIREIERRHTELFKDTKQKSLQRKELAETRFASSFSKVAPEDSITVRVGIVEKTAGASLKAGGPFTLYVDGKAALKGKQGDLLFAKKSDGLLVLYDKNDKLLAQAKESCQIEYKNPKYTTAVFDIMNGAGYFFAGAVDRFYRGKIELLNKSKGLTLVNEVNMEEYLYSVLPSEMPASWPAEALKAQAVAARSYTIANMGVYRSRGFDLYGSITSQAYTGVGGEHPNTTKAVNATVGEVLYEADGKVTIAYYSANHGGYSESGDVVWGNRGSEHAAVADKKSQKREEFIPLYQLNQWLKERPLTHASWPRYHYAPAYRSVIWVSAEDMELRANRSKNIGRVNAIITRSRGISGRVGENEAFGNKGSSRIKGDAIRNRTGGLRSNLYTIEYKMGADNRPEYFIIRTGGWGHGVGMDQSGAAGMAADGYSYKDILNLYYPNAALKAYEPLKP